MTSVSATSAKSERVNAAVRIAIGALLVTTCCFAALVMGRTQNSVEVLIWPGDAIILALMLGPCRRTPFSLLIVCELCGLLASLHPILDDIAASRQSWAQFIAVHIIVSGRVTLTYMLTRRLLGSNTPIHSKGLVAFLGAAGVSSLMAAGLQTALMWRQGSSHGMMFAMAFSATMAGYAVLTPSLLLLTDRNLAVQALSRLRPDSVAGLLLAPTVTLGVFWQSHYPLLYLAPLVLIGVAYIVDLFTAALATLASCAIMSVLFLAGHGPVYLIAGSAMEKLFFMQIFLVVVAATTLPIAALMSEHARLKASLIGARVEAEADNQAKSVFLATMSHEIRTPLNGVLGMAQAIAMGELPPRQRERLQVLHQSGEALLTILNDVLDLSKIEAGKLVMESIAFDLEEILGGAARNYDPLAQEKGLTLHFDIGNAAGVYLGDPTRLRQIVYNLVANALKFTSNGSVSLSARFMNDHLVIDVADTGIGIPKDKLGKLFVKFSQVDESTTRNFGGTGLGLSICRELAELMGGQVMVSSIQGKGSRFTLDVPLVRVDGPRAAPVDVPQILEMALGIRVLAAEDNPTNRLVLKTLLEMAGVQLTLVENGAEAVKAWAGQPWDVILMDVQMPVMDGPTATREIRRQEALSGRGHTPIVALTAATMTHQIDDFLAAGMDLHLAKPIRADQLLQTLSQIAEERDQATGRPFPATAA